MREREREGERLGWKDGERERCELLVRIIDKGEEKRFRFCFGYGREREREREREQNRINFFYYFNIMHCKIKNVMENIVKLVK